MLAIKLSYTVYYIYVAHDIKRKSLTQRTSKTIYIYIYIYVKRFTIINYPVNIKIFFLLISFKTRIESMHRNKLVNGLV